MGGRADPHPHSLAAWDWGTAYTRGAPTAGQASFQPLLAVASPRPAGPPPPQLWSLWEPDSSGCPAGLASSQAPRDLGGEEGVTEPEVSVASCPREASGRTGPAAWCRGLQLSGVTSWDIKTLRLYTQHVFLSHAHDPEGRTEAPGSQLPLPVLVAMGPVRVPMSVPLTSATNILYLLSVCTQVGG